MKIKNLEKYEIEEQVNIYIEVLKFRVMNKIWTIYVNKRIKIWNRKDRKEYGNKRMKKIFYNATN